MLLRYQSEGWFRTDLMEAHFFYSYNFMLCTDLFWGMQWHSWSRHCATSRKVAGSIPDGVTGIFHWHNASSGSVALGSTRPLTETSTRVISWGTGGQRIRLTTLPHSCADCLEIPGALRSPGLWLDNSQISFTVNVCLENWQSLIFHTQCGVY